MTWNIFLNILTALKNKRKMNSTVEKWGKIHEHLWTRKKFEDYLKVIVKRFNALWIQESDPIF